MRLTHDPDTFVSLLTKLARERPDLPLFTFLDAEAGVSAVLTSRKLMTTAQRIASLLQAKQVSAAPVMILSPFGPAAVEQLFGVMMAGCSALPVTFHRRLGMTDIVSVIASTGVRVVIGKQQVLTKLKTGRFNTASRFRAREHDLLYLPTDNPAPDSACLPPVLASDSALVYPGRPGSAGREPVFLSHADLLGSVDNLISVLSADQVDTSERLLTCHDLADGMALLMHVLLPVRAGIPSLLYPPASALRDAGPWLRSALQHRCTIISAPPAVLLQAAHDDQSRRHEVPDFGALRFLSAGGEYVAPGVINNFIERYRHKGMVAEKVFSCYGLSGAATFVAGRRGFKVVLRGQVPYLALGVPDERCRPVPDCGDQLLQLDNELVCAGRIAHEFRVDDHRFQAGDIESLVLQAFGARGLSRCVLLRLDDMEQTVLLAECASRQLADNWQGVVLAMMDAVMAGINCRLDRVMLLRPGSLPLAVSGIVLRQRCAASVVDGSLMLRLLPVRGK